MKSFNAIIVGLTEGARLIVPELVSNGYSVEISGAKEFLKSENYIGTVFAYSIISKNETDTESFLDIITDILTKKNISYFSVIVIDSQAGITWCGSNITDKLTRLKQKSEKAKEIAKEKGFVVIDCEKENK